MAAVEENGHGIGTPETRPYAAVRKGYTYFAEGDVLFAKITPCLQNGKHAIARGLIGGFGFGTTEFHVLRPTPGVLPDWVLHFLLQPSVLEGAQGHFSGTVGQQRVPAAYLAELKIPLPSVSEQRRIVNKLNEQLAAVERARAAAEMQLNAANRLFVSSLGRIFEELRAWPTTTIGTIAAIQSGYAFRSAWFSKSGIRLLRNANVFQGSISWDDCVYLPEGRRREFKAFELQQGDIVLSLDRPIVSGGLKVSRLSSADVPALLLQRVARFQVSDKTIPSYLYAFLQSSYFQKAITGHNQSLGVPHVSPRQVAAVSLPHPPLEVQQRVVERVAIQQRYSLQMTQSVMAQLASIEVLRKMLLQEAFNGNSHGK